MIDSILEQDDDVLEKIKPKSVTISGSRLWHHDIDHSLNYKNLGVKKPFQLVIFQGGSGETNTAYERNIFSSFKKYSIYNLLQSPH